MATAPTTALQPGMTGSAVLQLQQYLMSLGLLTQAQINTGPGIYGPQTTAAVTALQQKLGVNNSSGPGYYGPLTIAAATKTSTPAPAPAPTATSPQTLDFTPPTTGGSTTPATTSNLSIPTSTPSTGTTINFPTTGALNLGNSGSTTSTAPAAMSAAPAANTSTGGSSGQITNAQIAALGNLQPGSTGASVTTLQQWLVQNGYLTQAQMNTGPGTYGPATTAAVAAWQNANGINTNGNPGYFGPISQNFLTSGQTSSSSGTGSTNSSSSGTGATGSGTGTGSTGTGSGTGSTGSATGTGNIPGTNIPSTGNSNLDSILGSLYGLIQSGKAVIPPGLQITPQLTQQFLAWAHQVVDPQTQQLLQTEAAGINASLQNQATQYGLTQGQDIQQFGQDLAANDNSNAAAGTAFSGLRNTQDQNLVNSTNRTLQSLDANTNYNISSALQSGGAALGSSNASLLNSPTLNSASVGQTGGNLSGSQGGSNTGPSLDFSYNPSLYTAGTIPSSQSTAVSNLAGNYLSQYGTLAGANSGQSIGDLIGGITGLPAGYTVPAGLT